jgi:hypothetical protein
MKRSAIILLVVFQFFFVNTYSQSQEATQLLLNYEKLKQLEKILDNMYKGYKILTQGYNRIKNIAEGNYKLHQGFLDGLYAVNPSVRKYQRIGSIIQYQEFLIKEGKSAYKRFQNDSNLTPSEIKYIATVYSSLAKQSLRNLDELTMIITASKLRMSDDERLAAIDNIYFDMMDKVSFLRYLNNSTQLLIIQRSKEKSELAANQKLYGIED